ncbi:MAG TPA: DUF1844 domain-containing protein [Candidatus Methylomirabilis sp.]|jgi:hypothetical protein
MGRAEQEPHAAEAAGVTFSDLVLMFGTTVLLHLGLAPDPVSGEKKLDLIQAKQAIDVLDLLKGKTAGNLTPEESSMLENVLFDLRMRYLEAVRRV